jgi:hypothetical protein
MPPLPDFGVSRYFHRLAGTARSVLESCHRGHRGHREMHLIPSTSRGNQRGEDRIDTRLASGK